MLNVCDCEKTAMPCTDTGVTGMPRDAVKDAVGFSVDMGGSLTKLMYRSKDDSAQSEPNSQRVKLHMKSFPRGEEEAALAYIRDHALIRRETDQVPLVHTTGIGFHQWKDRFCQELKIRIENTSEIENCVLATSALLRSCSQAEMVHPVDQQANQEGIRVAKYIRTIYQQFSSNQNGDESIKDLQSLDGCLQLAASPPPSPPSHSTRPFAEVDHGVFPYLLVNCGSAAVLTKVQRDGSFMAFDGTSRGGLCLVSMGSLLLGTKGFTDLMALAEKGNDSSIHDYRTLDSDTNNQADKMLIFAFGHARNKQLGEFQKEDLARAIVSYIMDDLAQLVTFAAIKHDVKHIFLSGNMVDHGLVRHLLTKYLTQRKVAVPNKGDLHFHFMRHGGYIGCLGAMLQNSVPR